MLGASIQRLESCWLKASHCMPTVGASKHAKASSGQPGCLDIGQVKGLTWSSGMQLGSPSCSARVLYERMWTLKSLHYQA